MYRRCPRCFMLLPEKQTVHWRCFFDRARYILLGGGLLAMSIIIVIGIIVVTEFDYLMPIK